MDEHSSGRAKTCFVICPIGEKDSAERAWSDDIFFELIRPVAEEHGYIANRAIDAPRPGEITANIIADLVEADLVIADLTFHNANVFYELAIRHAQGKPFFHVAARGTRIPFDISIINTVMMDTNTVRGVNEASKALARQFEAVQNGTADFNNPVKRHQQKLHAEQSGDPTEKRLLDIEEQMNQLQRAVMNTAGRSYLLPSNRSRRLISVSRKIIGELDAEIKTALLSNTYRLIFNPKSQRSKIITFMEDGSIGEGQNSNEHSWRITDGRLELLGADGSVHSRFIYASDNNEFYHTNDPDTPSIKGQQIIPVK